MTTAKLVHLADLETIYDDPERVAGLVREIRSLPEERTLVVGSGDTTALGALSFVTDEGREFARPLYEAIEPDADTLGNHEFDFGTDWACEWVRTTPGTHLLANVDGLGSAPTEPHAVVDVDDLTVGLVGVTHPETAELSGIDLDVTVSDPVEAVAREAARLREFDCDWIVVLSHCGGLDERIAAETDVDAVLGGHDHERVVEVVDSTLVARTRGGQAGEFQLLSVETTGADASAADGVTVERREIPTAPATEGVAATYRDWYRESGLAAQIATLPSALDRRQTAAVVARAYQSPPDVDVGIVTPGSVRGGLPKTVTRGDVVGVVPFGSTLDVHRIDGEALATLAAETGEPIDETHGRLITAGIERGETGEFPVADETGEFPVADEAGKFTVNEEPLDPSDWYRVACMSYLTVVDAVPAIGESTLLERRGAQHEYVVSAVENGGAVEQVRDRQ